MFASHPLSAIAQVQEVSCGAEVSYARTSDGEVYAWGFGENMQLGNGQGVDDATESLLVPTLLEGQSIEVPENLFLSVVVVVGCVRIRGQVGAC